MICFPRFYDGMLSRLEKQYPGSVTVPQAGLHLDALFLYGRAPPSVILKYLLNMPATSAPVQRWSGHSLQDTPLLSVLQECLAHGVLREFRFAVDRKLAVQSDGQPLLARLMLRHRFRERKESSPLRSKPEIADATGWRIQLERLVQRLSLPVTMLAFLTSQL